jgi:hypothetical protein
MVTSPPAPRAVGRRAPPTPHPASTQRPAVRCPYLISNSNSGCAPPYAYALCPVLCTIHSRFAMCGVGVAGGWYLVCGVGGWGVCVVLVVRSSFLQREHRSGSEDSEVGVLLSTTRPLLQFVRCVV